MSGHEISTQDQAAINRVVRCSIDPAISALMTNPPKDEFALGEAVLSACVDTYGGSIDNRLPIVRGGLIQVSPDTTALSLGGDTEGMQTKVTAEGRWFSHVLSCEVVVRDTTVARFSGKRGREGNITVSEAMILRPDVSVHETIGGSLA